MNETSKSETGEANAPRVGQFVTIKGKQYQVSRDSNDRWVKESNDDFAAQPVNPKTGKGWQAERRFTLGDVDGGCFGIGYDMNAPEKNAGKGGRLKYTRAELEKKWSENDSRLNATTPETGERTVARGEFRDFKAGETAEQFQVRKGARNAVRSIFGRSYIGCYIDGSSDSADYINEATISFAQEHGFECKEIEDNEDRSQILSEEGDNAVSFLNDQDCLPYCSWYFEDNSLFYGPCMENVQEEVPSFNGYDGLPVDFEGEWLEVNDHGNATLYIRSNGEDKEVWAVV